MNSEIPADADKGDTAMTALVSDKTFDEEVLKSSEPVLVDFFAEWCGPCKAMAPALEQLAAEQKGKVKVVKIDVDQSPGITTKYGIRAMPTLIVFKNGEVAGQHVGALVQKRKLEEWLGAQIGETLVKA
jgi:thioredoxin 1